MSPPSPPMPLFQLAVREVDRRRHPRLPALYHLVMQVAGSKRIVSIEDISLSGVAVFSAEPPGPGTPVILAFPKQTAKPEVLVGVSGRIVRQAGTGVAGIVFDPGQERTVKGILRFLPAVRGAYPGTKPADPPGPARKRKPAKATAKSRRR